MNATSVKQVLLNHAEFSKINHHPFFYLKSGLSCSLFPIIYMYSAILFLLVMSSAIPLYKPSGRLYSPIFVGFHILFMLFVCLTNIGVHIRFQSYDARIV